MKLSTLLLALKLLAILAGQVFADWYEYNPQGAANGGMLREVESRCSAADRQRLAKYSDPITRAHEGTHFINGDLGRQMGTFGLYVGGGRVFVGREPRISREQIIGCITKTGPLYRHYFHAGPLIDTWKVCRLYALDEWVAATNGMQAAKELNVSPGADAAMAVEFCEYADATVRAVRRFDPGYQHLNQLAEFVEWHKARVYQLAGMQ